MHVNGRPILDLWVRTVSCLHATLVLISYFDASNPRDSKTKRKKNTSEADNIISMKTESKARGWTHWIFVILVEHPSFHDQVILTLHLCLFTKLPLATRFSVLILQHICDKHNDNTTKSGRTSDKFKKDEQTRKKKKGWFSKIQVG